jgi:polar amino acid transport system substrate-binding protein
MSATAKPRRRTGVQLTLALAIATLGVTVIAQANARPARSARAGTAHAGIGAGSQSDVVSRYLVRHGVQTAAAVSRGIGTPSDPSDAVTRYLRREGVRARASSVPTMTSSTLVVGLDYPQVNFDSGKVRGLSIVDPKGFEVDLAAAIAKNLGLTPKYVFAPWGKLFAPGAKSFDISFQEVTITAQRRKTVDFTSSYFDANQGVLLSKTAKALHTIADLKSLQTCAGVGTTGLAWIEQKLRPAKKPLVYPSATAMFHAVQTGRCDALILDAPIIASEKKAQPARYGVVAGQIVTHEQYGGVLRKGSALTPIIDRQIAKLWADGTIAKLQKKWFDIDFSKMPVLR